MISSTLHNISHLATALGQGDGLLCEKGSYMLHSTQICYQFKSIVELIILRQVLVDHHSIDEIVIITHLRKQAETNVYHTLYYSSIDTSR